MGRKSAPINIVVHRPDSDKGERALARRAAEIHADAVEHMIQRMDCPTEQKKQLLDAIIKDASVRG